MIPSATRRACSTGATEIKRDMRTVCLIDCVFALDLPLAEPRKICCHLCGMSGFAAKAQNKFPSEKGGSLMSPVSLGRFNTIPNSWITLRRPAIFQAATYLFAPPNIASEEPHVGMR